MNRLQATVRQRVLPAFIMALLAVAMASTSGVSAPADTFVRLTFLLRTNRART